MHWHPITAPPPPGGDVLLFNGRHVGLVTYQPGRGADTDPPEETWDMHDYLLESALNPGTWRWAPLPGADAFRSGYPPVRREVLVRLGPGQHSTGTFDPDNRDAERTPDGWILDDYSAAQPLPPERTWTWTAITLPDAP